MTTFLKRCAIKSCLPTTEDPRKKTEFKLKSGRLLSYFESFLFLALLFLRKGWNCVVTTASKVGFTHLSSFFELIFQEIWTEDYQDDCKEENFNELFHLLQNVSEGTKQHCKHHNNRKICYGLIIIVRAWMRIKEIRGNPKVLLRIILQACPASLHNDGLYPARWGFNNERHSRKLKSFPKTIRVLVITQANPYRKSSWNSQRDNEQLQANLAFTLPRINFKEAKRKAWQTGENNWMEFLLLK